jgi:ACS family glucarate transporter-like MFS transporter
MAYRHRTLGFLFFLSVITYLDRVCISVAGPRMQAELQLTPDKWGWVIGAFTIGYAFFEIPGGMMADRWGARVALTRIVLLWSLFTSLTGLVSGFGLLLLVRFLFGAGEAGAFPGATSAISRWFPAHERSRSQGVVWMASRLGGMVAPFLVMAIQTRWGWRPSFFLFGAIGLVWAAAWFYWYRDRPAEKSGLSAAELQLIQRGGGALGGQHVPVPWRHVMKQGNFWRLLLTYHAYSWGAFFYVGWLHTYLQKGRGFSEGEMTFWSALPFACGAAGNFLGGTLSDVLVKRRGLRFGRRSIATTGLALGAAFLMVTALTENRIWAASCLCLGFFAMDSFLPVAWAMTADLGRRSAGTIAGAMNMAGQLGSFVSSVAFGYIVKLTGGNYSRAMLPLAVMTGLAAVLSARIDPTQPFVTVPVAVDDDPAAPPG